MPVFDDIRLLRVTFLRGPNLWTYRSALEVWLDLGALEEWPSDRLPGFLGRLTAELTGPGRTPLRRRRGGGGLDSACVKAPGWAMCSNMW